MDEKEAKEKSKEQLDQLFDKIKSMLPAEAEFVKAEFEGPDIVIYLKNAKAVYQDDAIVRGIASSVKKKLIIRSDESHLMEPEKAKDPTGRILSTVINDVEKARLALSDYLADLFQKSFTFVALVAVMLVVNWKLALGTAIPSGGVPGGQTGEKDPHVRGEGETRLGDLSQILEETVSGNRVVKAFGMEDFESHNFGRRMLRDNMRWVRAFVLTSPLMDLLGGLVIPLLLLYARNQIQHGQMTTGAFFTFIFAMFNAYMPLKRMGYVYQQFEAAQGASTQVFAYLDRVEEKLDEPSGNLLAPFSRKSCLTR